MAEIENIGAANDERRANVEKLKGRFKLRMNKNLSMPQKVIKYAQEPVVFHLHKKRNFFHKIQGQLDDDLKIKNEAEYAKQVRDENELIVAEKLKKD